MFGGDWGLFLSSREAGMKQQINFLNELPKRKRDFFTFDFSLRAFAGFFVFLMMIYGVKALVNIGSSGDLSQMSEREKNLSEQIEKLNQDYPDAAGTAEPQKIISSLEQDIQKRTQVLEMLKQKKASGADGFAEYLTALSALIPEDVWLDEIKIQKEGEIIGLSGSAMSSESIGLFVKRLSNNSVFKNKKFEAINIKKAKQESAAWVDFLISTHVEEVKTP